MKNRWQFVKDVVLAIWPFLIIMACIIVLFRVALPLIIEVDNNQSLFFISIGINLIILGCVRLFHKKYRSVFLKHSYSLYDLKGGYPLAILGMVFITIGIIQLVKS